MRVQEFEPIMRYKKLLLDKILLLYNSFSDIIVRTNTGLIENHRNISNYQAVIKILKDIFIYNHHYIKIYKNKVYKDRRSSEAQLSNIT